MSRDSYLERLSIPLESGDTLRCIKYPQYYGVEIEKDELLTFTPLTGTTLVLHGIGERFNDYGSEPDPEDLSSSGEYYNQTICAAWLIQKTVLKPIPNRAVWYGGENDTSCMRFIAGDIGIDTDLMNHEVAMRAPALIPIYKFSAAKAIKLQLFAPIFAESIHKL